MSTKAERTKKLEDLKKLFDELITVNPESLSRRADLTAEINFSDAVPNLAIMIGVVKDLSERDLSRLNQGYINAVINSCKTLKGFIDQIRTFNIDSATPGATCKAIIQGIDNGYDTFMTESLMATLSFTSTESTDYTSIEREAKGLFATMKQESDKYKEELKKSREEAKNALEAIKELAAEGGVSANAQIYESAASNYSNYAAKWFQATIMVSVFALITAGVFFWLVFSYTPETTAKAIQYVFGKLIILSIITYVVYWCASNYKSNKHNQVLNEHRANALKTYRAFVEGSVDPRIKDAILLHAANAAFSCHGTGYEKNDSEQQSMNPVVEILGKSIPSQISGK
ncbi:MAG: hypothetical protein JW803_04265 [Endomicrobiales bacterium]|nr:hypothetical protein [Endomicrobiales bacterium]